MLIQSLNGLWQLRQAGSAEWLAGQVPGDVHTALLAAGRIPDPFVADSEKRVQWVAETDWEYRWVFTPEPELLHHQTIFLTCAGLDTLAEVRFNGRALGNTANMFRQYSWDVKALLQAGENELVVRFSAPVEYIRSRQQEKRLTGGGDIPGGPHLRKAPYQWGWDWGPKLPPIGIWKDIYLEGFDAVRLADVRLRQQHAGGAVTLSAGVTTERWQDGDCRAVMEVTAPDGRDWQAEAALEGLETAARLEVPIQDPQLWWPNGYGSQPLYAVRVALYRGNELCDRRDYQVGLRTIALRQEPDAWGESFTFVVNGVPLFAKGANWIPADSFPTRIRSEQLESLLGSAAAASMNMLRVWGGGLYEEERFYDLCDRYGLLVWQDFTFACGIYPDAEEFFENVRLEAIQNVRRLRHRACLAIWCGNNEMEQGWAEWGWNRPNDPANQRLKAAYDRMFHQLLPDICAAEDPDRLYWPSSASSGIPFAEPSSQQRGDVHYWDVWHKRQPFTAYRSQYPRFMSEFGFQALPPLETIRTYAGRPDWNMTSYIMEHHQRSGSGNGLIISQMTDMFRMPKDFPALVYLSMVLQAEGIRYGVEHWRRNCERVSGTLYWQLNDCWPVASWSSLDYFGRWKALHYAARRFYAPLLLSIEDSGLRMGVHVTSDHTTAWQGQVRWRLETLGGAVLDLGKQAVQAAPLADTTVCELDFSAQVSDESCRWVVFICELWQGEERLAVRMATFVPNKHLELVEPGLAAHVRLEGDRLVFELAAQSLARFVELRLDGVDVVFSDNYFDLPAGSRASVDCPLPAGLTLEAARAALCVRSLYDSFALSEA